MEILMSLTDFGNIDFIGTFIGPVIAFSALFPFVFALVALFWPDGSVFACHFPIMRCPLRPGLYHFCQF